MRAFLVRSALGRREDLEPLVGDRLSTLDRDPVRSRGEALLGSLDGGELFAEIVPQTLVELVLVEIGCEIRRVELIGRLAVFLVRAPLERALDPRALGRQ